MNEMDTQAGRGCLLWSDDLTDKQLAMVMACKGDGTQLGDSVGYELRGSAFTVARALERKGLGVVDGVGGSLPPLFWLNEDGVRIAHEFDKDPDDDGFDEREIGCVNCDGGWRHGCCDDLCRGSNDPEWCDFARKCPTCNPHGEVL